MKFLSAMNSVFRPLSTAILYRHPGGEFDWDSEYSAIFSWQLGDDKEEAVEWSRDIKIVITQPAIRHWHNTMP